MIAPLKRNAVLSLFFMLVLFNSCIFPASKPLQSTSELKQFETELAKRLQSEYVKTYSRAQRQNGNDNYFVCIVICNLKNLSTIPGDLSILATEIAVDLYPYILNIEDYTGIEVIYESKKPNSIKSEFVSYTYDRSKIGIYRE